MLKTKKKEQTKQQKETIYDNSKPRWYCLEAKSLKEVAEILNQFERQHGIVDCWSVNQTITGVVIILVSLRNNLGGKQ